MIATILNYFLVTFFVILGFVALVGAFWNNKREPFFVGVIFLILAMFLAKIGDL